jgi:glycosyltransferase involved in cell wall biosynthesis
MKEIVLVTISLNKMAGGLERNFIWLANSLSNQKYVVTLLTFDLQEATSFYGVNKNIEWEKVGKSEAHKKLSIVNKIQTIFAIRKILKPKTGSLVVVFHHGILARIFLASLGLKLKIICSERNALSLYKWVKKSKLNLNFILLIFVNRITVQFDKYVKDYPFFLRKKIIVIGNPVGSPNVNLYSDLQKADPLKTHIILNVGRLSSQKNQDILIRQFEKLVSKYPEWNLCIVGNGELGLPLKSLIDDLKLRNRVFIIEPSNDIEKWYTKADIFCMPSRWEGFPNALAEALSYGLPSVGLLECDGVNQLIKNNLNGFLCGVDEIADYLEILIVNEQLRKRFSSSALEILEKYNPLEAEKKWISMIEGL